MSGYFARPVTPDWRALVSCIRREGTPKRTHHIELFLDSEVQQAIAERYGLWDGMEGDDPDAVGRRQIAIQRFLGYDYVRCSVEGMAMEFRRAVADDTAGLGRTEGRSFQDEHTGPIASWDEFAAYPWPDPEKATTRMLDWYSENLPDDMCIIGSGGFAHFAEHLTWLMGYETLCFALYDQRDLVKAISDRLIAIHTVVARRLVEFDRVKLLWGSDDMGFKTGLLISPADTREFILPGHRIMARIAHEAARPYLLHSCGNLSDIMEDLIEDVRIDAKHSYEDTIESVIDVKKQYGDRMTILGGIDVDFLCRADEEAVRRRVRRTLEACLPGGGYCLGTGNSVANYIPLDNYLAMMDEGRNFTVG